MEKFHIVKYDSGYRCLCGISDVGGYGIYFESYKQMPKEWKEGGRYHHMLCENCERIIKTKDNHPDEGDIFMGVIYFRKCFVCEQEYPIIETQIVVGYILCANCRKPVREYILGLKDDYEDANS